MPRRARITKRPVLPDGKYHNKSLGRFINRIMMRGKKSVAESIVYDALTTIEAQAKKSPVEVFEQALKNVTPLLEVKPRRVGGATYQVPVEIKGDRRNALAMRWLISAARNRAGKSMAQKLASELLDAAQGVGTAIKKREDTHRMAEANKAFAHYRW
ncbi:MAG: 30S ribosomal protein S7 [Chloroflexi bacterium]|nr:30S ribosomal protein S7 [Chloroflexota bacterium]MDA8189287.1 30S ribosomal protein S7 [Dehalococcoidales bacterium]